MLPSDDLQAVQKLNEAYRQITSELSKVIVGQQQVIEELLISLFAFAGIVCSWGCRGWRRR